ncbi:uncharacterized protein [Prorops nasuta]|uniref:uncharacterized protein n=1 Tax=Prorops nasuta TaxID=863751 RepID=UPI0034CD2B58
MKWPIILTCFLMLRSSCIFGASFQGCYFPERWNGRWFQSGVPEPVTVNGSIITSKGHCIEAKGDKFLVRDPHDNCYRCLVIYEKHPNVLQYKESECTAYPSKPNLSNVLTQIRGDAQLNSLFRSGAAPSACPIKGPLEFTYSQSQEGECSSPPSQAEACTQESRLFLRYQACANVRSSQSIDVELECLATWKDGSTPYMLGRLYGNWKTSDENSYRCFVYSKTSNNSWYLAQSADAACNGLNSITDGEKTLKLKQKNLPEYCAYPSWLVSAKSWVALDRMAPRLLASAYNLTILDRNETRLVCHSYMPLDDRSHHHHSTSSTSHRENSTVKLIAKATRGCKNGYVCMMFHRRDEHVIEMQQSQWSQEPENVCNSSTFNAHSPPYTTFITTDYMTRQCPYLGRYEIRRSSTDFPASGNSDYSDDILNFEEQGGGNVAEVQDARATTSPFFLPSRCNHESVRRLDIGCRSPDRMEYASSCAEETLSVEYLCHGTWVENDTGYLVVTTDAGRYCLVYSASAATTGSRELFVRAHLASCPRASHRHEPAWRVNLTSYAHCDDTSGAISWTSSKLQLLVIFSVLFSRYVVR